MNAPTPMCPADGCARAQAVRRDGVPLGWCAEHRSARIRSAALGTVRPGPRGKGWRVKTGRQRLWKITEQGTARRSWGRA